MRSEGGSAGGHLAAFTALAPGLDDPADDPAVSRKPDAFLASLGWLGAVDEAHP